MTSISVLHVDDDDGFLRMATEYLNRTDPSLAVQGASNAEAGLRALEEETYDCVVSDSVELADGTPFVVAATERQPDLPVVLYTALPAESLGDDVADVTERHVRKRTAGAMELVGSAILELCTERDPGVRPPAVGGPAADEGPDAGSVWRTVERVDFDAPGGVLSQVLSFLGSELDLDVARAAPLYESVDAEALERLVSHCHGSGEPLVVVFTYEGHDVLVSADGLVGLRPSHS